MLQVPFPSVPSLHLLFDTKQTKVFSFEHFTQTSSYSPQKKIKNMWMNYYSSLEIWGPPEITHPNPPVMAPFFQPSCSTSICLTSRPSICGFTRRANGPPWSPTTSRHPSDPSPMAKVSGLSQPKDMLVSESHMLRIHVSMYIYIYKNTYYVCMYVYIYIYRERESLKMLKI